MDMATITLGGEEIHTEPRFNAPHTYASFRQRRTSPIVLLDGAPL